MHEIPGSVPSYLPDTHTIWAKVTFPVSSGGGGAPPPTVGANGTADHSDSFLTVYGGTVNLVHNMQAAFSGLSNTVTDPYFSACFEQLAKIWGYLK